MTIATRARDGSPRAVADTGRRVASLEVLNVDLDLDSPHLSTVAPASDAPAAPRTPATTATLVPPQASPSEEFGLLLALGFGIPVGFITWLRARLAGSIHEVMTPDEFMTWFVKARGAAA